MATSKKTTAVRTTPVNRAGSAQKERTTKKAVRVIDHSQEALQERLANAKGILQSIANGEAVEALPFPDHPGDGIAMPVSAARACEIVSEYLDGNREQLNLRVYVPKIQIGGHWVPQPVSDPLEMDTEYFVPDLGHNSGNVDLYENYHWQNDRVDHSYLERGLVQRTPEGAIEQAKATIALFRQGLPG